MLFKNAKVYRFVPDQPGKGGSKTQVHSHQIAPVNDTFDVFNAHVFYGRWRKQSESYDLSPSLYPDEDVVTWTTQATATNGSNAFNWSSGTKFDVTEEGSAVTITDGTNTLNTTIIHASFGSGAPLSFTETAISTVALWTFPNATVTVTITTTTSSLVLHPFYKFSTTDASAPASLHILGHNVNRLHPTWQNRIWDYSTGALLKQATGFFANSVAAATLNSYNVTWVSGPKWDVSQEGYQVVLVSGGNSLTATITGVAGGTSTPGSFDNTTLMLTKPWPFTSGNVTATISSGFLPATFLNIKNRCHICWGGTRNFIFDGTSVYNSGIAAPGSSPTYTFDSSVVVTAGAYVTKGSAVITEVAPFGGAHEFGAGSALIGRTITLPNLAADGEDNYIVVSGADVNLGPPGTKSGVSGSNQVLIVGWAAPPNIYNGCYVTTTGGTNTSIPIASYVIAPNGADTIITLQSNLTASGAGGGNTFTTLVIQGYQLTLNLAYAGITAWSALAHGNTGTLRWVGLGPQYAYAYYDPLTGHISNISPVIQVTENDQRDVNVILHDITTTGDTRFTKIKIFRTILAAGQNGGSVLFQLTGGVGQPPDLNNTGGPLTFTDHYPDSTLLLAGTLQAPYLTNNPPPPFAHAVYWDGRIFGAPVDDPSAVRYSADNVQVTFGVPEESYPSRNVLRIPAADGRIVGMKLIGNQAIVMTERWAYTVIGNNETNYRLIRYSTHMQGVGDYQTDEFAGDTSESTDAVTYLGKDQRLYIMAPQLGNMPLSAPVQDFFALYLTNLDEYKQARVHTATIEGRKLIIVRLRDELLEFDFERKVWTRPRATLVSNQQLIPECFASLYGAGDPVVELWAYRGRVRAWLKYSPLVATDSAFIKTFPLYFESDEKKRRQLNFVRIYKVGGGTYSGSVWVGEANPTTTNFVVNSDPVYNLYPPGATPIDGAEELYWLPSGATSTSAQPYGGTTVLAPMQGYRFFCQITFPTDTLPTDLLAFDVCVSDVQEDDGVSL